MSQIKIGDIAVDVVLKDIKNVHLSVYQPVEEVWHGLEARVRTGFKPVPHPFAPVGNRCHTADQHSSSGC